MDLLEAKDIIEKNINKKVEVIKRFTGGMSNYTYLIKIENNLYTYRIPGANSEVFINRIVEKNNIEIVSKLDLNCKNLYLNISNGHKMSIFIEGEDLTNVVVDYEEVANSLRKLHTSGLSAVNDYDKEERLSYYESLVNTKHTDEYHELKNDLFNKLNEFKDIKLVFCHGDSQKSNWVQSNKLYLLDWEYSANNDPYYDIACFGNVDFNDAIKLLNSYLKKEPTNEEMNRLILNRLFQCLQWHNVALYKHEIGLSKSLNIDFEQISIKYLKTAQELYKMIKM
ncbi:MAG: choline/ethanolamine kinase family protein [bacterium]